MSAAPTRRSGRFSASVMRRAASRALGSADRSKRAISLICDTASTQVIDLSSLMRQRAGSTQIPKGYRAGRQRTAPKSLARVSGLNNEIGPGGIQGNDAGAIEQQYQPHCIEAGIGPIGIDAEH